MQYRVIGTSKQNGARMTLEFDAKSKLDAERKAVQQGLTVTRVENLSGEEAQETFKVVPGKPRSKGLGCMIWMLLVLLAAAAVVYFFFPELFAQMLSRFHAFV